MHENFAFSPPNIIHNRVAHPLYLLIHLLMSTVLFIQLLADKKVRIALLAVATFAALC